MPLWLDLSPKQAAAEHCCGARVASHMFEQPDANYICGWIAALIFLSTNIPSFPRRQASHPFNNFWGMNAAGFSQS